MKATDSDLHLQGEILPSTALEIRPPSLFVSKPANIWIEEASARPDPKPLFDMLWFEGELCFLFSDTNAGKSVLAVQIGDSITSGRPIPGFRMEAAPAKTLYFDLELSDKQFQCRYSENYVNPYEFSPDFVRAEIDPSIDLEPENNPESFFISEIGMAIEREGARHVILDNITFASDETEKSKSALRIMKGLKRLKENLGLSILALGHTPKRPLDTPLTQNHLAGSKMLINFADAAFAIGRSTKGPNVRYLKQIKVRSAPEEYGAGNVISCTLTKESNFLQFERSGTDPEREHLRESDGGERERLASSIRELHDTDPTLSQRQIAERLDTSAAKVNRVLKQKISP